MPVGSGFVSCRFVQRPPGQALAMAAIMCPMRAQEFVRAVVVVAGMPRHAQPGGATQTTSVSRTCSSMFFCAKARKRGPARRACSDPVTWTSSGKRRVHIRSRIAAASADSVSVRCAPTSATFGCFRKQLSPTARCCALLAGNVPRRRRGEADTEHQRAQSVVLSRPAKPEIREVPLRAEERYPLQRTERHGLAPAQDELQCVVFQVVGSHTADRVDNQAKPLTRLVVHFVQAQQWKP